MPPKMKFQEGEKVLCFHGPLLYEAKCVKYEVKEKNIRYFIHYNGWNKNWDEWVPESRVLKFNEASLQKQKELLKAHGAANKKLRAARKLEKEAAKKQQEKEKEKEKEKDKDKDKDRDRERASTPLSERQKKLSSSTTAKEGSSLQGRRTVTDVPTCPTACTDGPATPVPPPVQSTPVETAKTETPNTASDSKRKRARIDATVEAEEGFTSKIEVKIRIPDELKPWLVDDWDLISRQKMLVTLPAKHTVDSILDDYVKAKTAKANSVNKDAVAEMIQGIREYFNVMLGTQLLYKFERPQYGEILSEKPDVTMTSVYGAVHLLRLFVKLGGMLAYTALDEKSVQLLLTHIHDFIKYLQKNTSTLFSIHDYVVAPPEYHRKAI